MASPSPLTMLPPPSGMSSGVAPLEELCGLSLPPAGDDVAEPQGAAKPSAPEQLDVLAPAPADEPAAPLESLSGKTLIDALVALAPERLAEVTSSYNAFLEFRSAWELANPPSKPVAMSTAKVVATCKLQYRVAIGLEFKQWSSDKSSGPAGTSPMDFRNDLAGFAQVKWNYGKTCPKKVRQWLARCV